LHRRLEDDDDSKRRRARHPLHSANMLRRVFRGTFFGATAAGVGLGLASYKDEGLRRSLIFWGQAFPIYLHYEFVNQTTKSLPEAERIARFEALHEKYAPRARDICLSLRGFYLKTAQLVSTIANTVPPQYTALSALLFRPITTARCASSLALAPICASFRLRGQRRRRTCEVA
jgi:hypothetical protein